MALLSDGLLPASFRGVPFAVYASGTSVGRRVALHQYPGKDEPWAEDLGRDARRYRFRGFIVADDVVYLGGPIQLQRLLLLAAAEKSGPGTLTHPTLGIVNVVCTRCSIGEELQAGRLSEVEFEFVESGKKSFPSLLSTSSGLLSASNLCKVALAVDAVRVIAAIAGGSARSDLSASAAQWTSKTSSLGSDATALHRLASQLPGAYGRYAGGGNAGVLGTRASSYDASTTVADLIGIASAARVVITTAAATISPAIAAADLANASTIPGSITDLVQALADACADPSDAIRLMEQLLTFVPAGMATSAGEAIATMFRRAAAAALVVAAGNYQPTSADDAVSVMARIAQELDLLATTAADAGDDESYAALRAARVAVVKDLRERGGSLAQIASFSFGQPLPAIVLAQRLYRDPSRADELVTQLPASASPLFMPTTVEVLAA